MVNMKYDWLVMMSGGAAVSLFPFGILGQVWS